jgi:hypothetical protein
VVKKPDFLKKSGFWHGYLVAMPTNTITDLIR